MKLELGETIEIHGQKCLVCYETSYNNENFICVYFNGENQFYDI